MLLHSHYHRFSSEWIPSRCVRFAQVDDPDADGRPSEAALEMVEGPAQISLDDINAIYSEVFRQLSNLEFTGEDAIDQIIIDKLWADARLMSSLCYTYTKRHREPSVAFDYLETIDDFLSYLEALFGGVGVLGRSQHESLEEFRTACESADLLAVLIAGDNLNEDDPAQKKMVSTVRRHPSQLFANALMSRVNEMIGDGEGFLFGLGLRDALVEEYAAMDLDKSSRHTASLIPELQARAHTRFQGLMLGEHLSDLETLIRAHVIGVVYTQLDRMGGVRPCLDDFGDSFVNEGLTGLESRGEPVGQSMILDPWRNLLVAVLRQQIRRIQRGQEEALEEAMTDPLTGLGNRRRFDAELHKRIPEGGEGRRSTEVALDLNGFKEINDHGYMIVQGVRLEGHPLGDYMLQEVVHELLHAMRQESTDVFCRTGGDEFMFILDGDLDEKAMHSILRRFDQAFERLNQRIKVYKKQPEGYDGPSIQLPLSGAFGVARYVEGRTVTELIQEGDQMLYRQKKDEMEQTRSIEQKRGYVLGPSYGEHHGRYDSQGDLREQYDVERTLADLRGRVDDSGVLDLTKVD